MANGESFFSAQENIRVPTYNDFKNDLIEKLTWNKQQWMDAGFSNTHLNKLCNLIIYWRKQIAEAFHPNTLILTLFNAEREAHVNVEAILNTIATIIPGHKIKGYFRPRNRKIIGIDFDSEDTKKKVEAKLMEVQGNKVVSLEWADTSKEIDLRVHWYHRRITDTRLALFFKKYFIINSVTRDADNFKNFSKLESGLISIKATLNEGMGINDIPHLTYIGGMQVLITVKGRVSLCLSCETLGHIASRCPMPFCKICKANKYKKHVHVEPSPKTSYAQALNKEECDLREDVESDMEESDPEQTNEELLAALNAVKERVASTIAQSPIIAQSSVSKQIPEKKVKSHLTPLASSMTPRKKIIAVKFSKGPGVSKSEGKGVIKKKKGKGTSVALVKDNEEGSKKGKTQGLALSDFIKVTRSSTKLHNYGKKDPPGSTIVTDNVFDLLTDSTDPENQTVFD